MLVATFCTFSALSIVLPLRLSDHSSLVRDKKNCGISLSLRLEYALRSIKGIEVDADNDFHSSKNIYGALKEQDR
jgi:hypothetical protein